MGLEFRQRGPSEYAQSLRRRKWLIILPTIAIASAIAFVVMRLPSVYQSSALLVVKQGSLTTSVLGSDPYEMSRKMEGFTKAATSRSNLEQLIKHYNLYKEERERGLSMDAIITKMATKDVEVELSQRNDIINGFTISFKGRDPRTAKAVTEELAGKCVSESVIDSTIEGEKSQEFFNQQVESKRMEMEAIEKERLDYMRNNLSNLPSEQAALVEQLSGLRDQQKTLYSEIGRLRDQATLQRTLLSAKKDQAQRDIARIQAENTDNITNSQVYAELVKQRTMLESELQQMKKTLTDKNPDVVAKREQIANVERQIEQERTRDQERIERRRKTLTEGLGNGETPETAAIAANIQGLDNERVRQEALLAQTDREIASINQRLSNIPTTEVNLDALTRRFQTAKAAYEDMLQKSQRALLASDVNKSNQGEALILRDAANLPQTPVAPKRALLIALGLALGFGIGLLLAMMAEAPRFFTIQTMDDAEHYTGLPVLVALPELMTPEEARRRPRLRLAALAAGLVVSLASVPVLIKVLSVTQLFERLVL